MRRYTPFLLLPALAFIIAAQNSDRQVQQEAQQKVREAFQSSVGEQLKSTLNLEEQKNLDVMAELMSREEQAAALNNLRALERQYQGNLTAQAELAKGYYAVAFSMQKEGHNKDARAVALKAYEMVKNVPSAERTQLINFLKTVRDEDGRPQEEASRAADDRVMRTAHDSPVDRNIDHVISNMDRTGTGSDVLNQAARRRGRGVTLQQLREAGIDIQLADARELGEQNAQVTEHGEGRFTIRVNRQVFEENKDKSPEALAALVTEQIDNAAVAVQTILDTCRLTLKPFSPDFLLSASAS